MATKSIKSTLLSAGMKTGLPDDILIKIGEITLNWNKAEGILEEMIWNIAGWGRSVGAFVTHDLGNVSRDQLCRNLIHHRIFDEKLKAELFELLSFFSEVRTRRNSLIHSIPSFTLRAGDMPNLEKRSAKSAIGEIKITQFVVSEIKHLSSDIAITMYAAAYSIYFIQRDRNFTTRQGDSPESNRAGFVWETHFSLPCIDKIRTRLKTIRSQHQHQDNKKRPPRSSRA